MNINGRPRVADAEKRINITCTISPETKRKLAYMREKGVKVKVGRIIDKFVEDWFAEQ